MAENRAVVVDPSVPGRLAIQEVPAPTAAPNEAIVRVAAVSLNRGEVRGAMSAAMGTRPGWDLAGTVESAAADGTGPKAGARVVGFMNSGAWAERAVVPTSRLAELPAGVSFAQAATLPVAGLTALYALERGNGLVGRDVLVTGASGGVGLFAVELAALGGATVTGFTRQEQHAQAVRESGAAHVVTGDDLKPAEQFGPFHLALDAVGGQTLSVALGLLGPRGVAVVFGSAGTAPVSFETRSFFARGLSLEGFLLFQEILVKPASEGLARLARLVADGKLHPRIAVEAPWTEIAQVAQQLMDRAYPGKAVLHVGG